MDRKCCACKRKTYLLVTCRCEKIVCLEHRYPEDHKCGFDYVKYGSELLEKQNPKIKTQKVEQI